MGDVWKYYDADAVRHLNVTNTDNRFLASAVRLLTEPYIAKRISWTQRGFISGPSMIANLIEKDRGWPPMP